MEILVSDVLGNGQRLDGGSMFGNVPRVVWSKWIAPDEQGRIGLACRGMLVEIGEKKILCETGIGAFFEPKMAERFGVQTPQTHVLLESLSKRGISHEDIDYVILSHLHFDHAGGLLPAFSNSAASNSSEPLLFPNAIYVVGEEAFLRSQAPHPRDRASFIPGLNEKLQSSGRLKVLKEGEVLEEFLGTLSFFISNGHTPGQLHTIVHGKKSKIIFAGDLVPGTAWAHLPVTMGYDRYPEKLIDEKKHLYEDILTKEDWVFYTHDTEVVCSQIEKNEKGKFIPHNLQSSLSQKAL